MKPRVFVASSSERLDIARKLGELLAPTAEVIVWDEAFRLSRGFMEALEQQAQAVDFCVVVLTADDTVRMRGKVRGAPRDNLLFELGLFMGALGRERTFFVLNGSAIPKLPSDLAGITAAVFNAPEVADLASALGPACDKIRQEIVRLRRLDRRAQLVAAPPATMEFTALAADLAATLDRLEAHECALLRQVEESDLPRLFDGLYANLLFTGRAILGATHAALYANAMELDAGKESLRVRHFSAPYNEEIILRSFPLRGLRMGVASVALTTQTIQVRNTMDGELMERGEERLKAMMQIPLETLKDAMPGAAVILSVDSATADIFPEPGSAEFAAYEERARALRDLARRINRLRASVPPSSSARTAK